MRFHQSRRSLGDRDQRLVIVFGLWCLFGCCFLFEFGDPRLKLGAVDDCDPRGVGRAPVSVSPDAKKYELGADPFCGVVGI